MVRGKTNRIGNIIPAIIEGWQKKLKGPAQKIFSVWEDAVGKKIAEQAKPKYVDGNKLCVEVKNSVWLSELSRFHKKEIIEKINEKLGEDLITEIRFQISTQE